jgi:hypothetical protein
MRGTGFVCSYISRKELLEVLKAPGAGKRLEEHREIRVRLDTVRLRGLNEGVQVGAGDRAFYCVAEQPAFSPNYKRSDRVLKTHSRTLASGLRRVTVPTDSEPSPSGGGS